MVGLCNVLASSFYSYYHAKKRLHKQKNMCSQSQEDKRIFSIRGRYKLSPLSIRLNNDKLKFFKKRNNGLSIIVQKNNSRDMKIVSWYLFCYVLILSIEVNLYKKFFGSLFVIYHIFDFYNITLEHFYVLQSTVKITLHRSDALTNVFELLPRFYRSS